MSAELRGGVVSVCSGPGGIPKRPVPEAQVAAEGLTGDCHRFEQHGGLDRAVCLFSMEDYAALQADGVACRPPGAFGENLLIEGLDFDVLEIGDRLFVGDEVELEIHDQREPCGTLLSLDQRFPDLLTGRSGWLCRVIAGGTLRPGQMLRVVRPA